MESSPSDGRPYVVAHLAVTLDGATTGFTPAIARLYELAGTWNEDVTLAGADTILAQEHALRDAPRKPAPDGAPLLAVVDGKGRVQEWEAMSAVGHWSGPGAALLPTLALPALRLPRAGRLCRTSP